MTTTTSCDSVINETTKSLNQFTGEVVSVAHTIDVRICEASYKSKAVVIIQSGSGVREREVKVPPNLDQSIWYRGNVPLG